MSLQDRRLAELLALTVSFSLSCAAPIHAQQNQSDRTVGLSELTVQALQNDPALVALRNNIPVEEARKRAATQWRDPEIRTGIGRDDNLQSNLPNAGNNNGGSDRSNSVRVRFFVPKPWEMKALVNQAAKEIEFAAFQVSAAERKVTLEVRAQYEELQYLARKLEASRGRIAIIEKHVANEKALVDAGGAFTLDMLSFEDIKIPGIKLAIGAAEAELNAAKRSLAARVCLADGSRIRSSDKLLRSGLDLQDTDLDYLTLMAFAHRGEVGVLKHEQGIAEAELGLLKTKRIPWFTFVETDYSRDFTRGIATEEGYGVRVAVILPLFSWLAKDEKVVEARIDSYYASLGANQKSIANEVAEAFRSVKEATAHRARTEATVARYSRVMKERAKDLEASEDPASQEKLRYDTETERYKFNDYSLAADRLYNQSLIRLEQALGADLDQVFKVEFESVSGSATAPSKQIPSAASQPAASTVNRAIPVLENVDQRSGNDVAKPTRKGLFKFLKAEGNDR